MIDNWLSTVFDYFYLFWNVVHIFSWFVWTGIEQSYHVHVHHEVWTVMTYAPIETKSNLFYRLPQLRCKMTDHLSVFT